MHSTLSITQQLSLVNVEFFFVLHFRIDFILEGTLVRVHISTESINSLRLLGADN